MLVTKRPVESFEGSEVVFLPPLVTTGNLGELILQISGGGNQTENDDFNHAGSPMAQTWSVIDGMESFDHSGSWFNMDLSENSGFSPQIIHFNRVFHYKPSILGYPYFWKHPYESRVSLSSLTSSRVHDGSCLSGLQLPGFSLQSGLRFEKKVLTEKTNGEPLGKFFTDEITVRSRIQQNLYKSIMSLCWITSF